MGGPVLAARWGGTVIIHRQNTVAGGSDAGKRILAHIGRVIGMQGLTEVDPSGRVTTRKPQVLAALTPSLTTTLQEFVIAAHFHAPLNINVLDLADWASAFPEFSKVQQVPPGGPVNLMNTPGIQFQVAGFELPRLLLTAESGLTVQLQSDRFAFGWIRQHAIGAPAPYPGFENLVQEFKKAFVRFANWHINRLKIPPPPTRLVELAYVNMVPLEREGERLRLSDIFKFVSPGVRKVNAFTTVWIEALSQEQDGPRVTAQVGLAKGPLDMDVLAFNFAGLANVGPNNDITTMINALHDRITDMYLSTMNASA